MQAFANSQQADPAVETFKLTLILLRTIQVGEPLKSGRRTLPVSIKADVPAPFFSKLRMTNEHRPWQKDGAINLASAEPRYEWMYSTFPRI